MPGQITRPIGNHAGGDGGPLRLPKESQSQPIAGPRQAETGAASGFDANKLSLQPGLRLLEASAGTGKTFALAHLVLRLVGERGHRLGEILVVTFTEAAAAELRDRIGRRLQEGLNALERRDADAAPDAVLAIWAQRCLSQSDEQQEQLRIRLLLALEELAAADITTIHGFCRRSLTREALSAGRPPMLQLEDPDDPGIQEVVHTYWREQVLSMPAHLLAGLRHCGLRPAVLEQLLRQLDGDPALQLDPLPEGWDETLPLSELLPDRWLQLWQHFCERWQQQGRSLQAALQAEALRWKQQELGDSKPYAPGARSDRCGQIDSWIAALPETGDYAATVRQKLLSDYYHPGVFSRVARRLEQSGERDMQLPEGALMQAIAALQDEPAELLLLHALHHCRSQLLQRRRRRGVSSFSQLLADLDPDTDESGPSAVLDAVAQRYRAALIDEFQDTDPIQWRILRRSFGQGRHLLVMVGDPKQAIYRFRGGDLRTYLEAADQTQERHSLNENRRSSPSLVDGLNRLMQPGLVRSKLPVPGVQACADRDGPATAIELLWLGEGQPADSEAGQEPASTRHPSRSELERQQPQLMALHLRELLARGLQLADGERQRPLRPEDICLLVSSHRQAEALRSALERHAIATRLVSRADVFDSAAAAYLQRFLDALADPGDANRMRLLVASPLLAWSPSRIAAATAPDWAELAERLSGLARQLPSRGLLGVLSELLASDGMARLNRKGRLAADLQQVSELVQRRLHADQLSPAALADWLRQLRLEPERQVPESHQAHSDRADGTVSVITIHRSKGLEFPVVLCPFLWQAPSSGARRLPGRRWQPPGSSNPVLDLHRNPHWGRGWAAERQQRLAEASEAERLAYVALTRAQHLLVLAWGPAQEQQASPLLPWLFACEPSADLDEDRISQASASHWRQQLEDGIRLRQMPLRVITAEDVLRQAGAAASPTATALQSAALAIGPTPQRRLDRRWGRCSYSGWVHAAGKGMETGLAPQALEEGRDTADSTPAELLEPSSAASDPTAAGDPMAQSSSGSTIDRRPAGAADPADPASDSEPLGPLALFPGGAVAGDCLHRMLEHMDYSRPLQTGLDGPLIEQELQRSGFEARYLPMLIEGFERLRLCPFGGELGAWRLADLPSSGWINELRFDLSLGEVRAAALAAAFRNWPGGAFGSDYANRVADLPIADRGFLTGSIDLVVPVQDSAGHQRWWLIDWKSNWLGQRDEAGQPLRCGPADYGQAAMVELMAASHYPLQAHLYLVALHRYLRWRLPDYDPSLHLGGYGYVFLRGVPAVGSLLAGIPEQVPGIVVERPPLQRLLALDAALGHTLHHALEVA